MTASRTDAVQSLLDELAQRRDDPVLRRTTGTLRFDLEDRGRTEHWFVAIQKGVVAVSHSRARADTVVQVEKALFQAILAGQANAMAAMLRGAMVIQGDLGLLVSFSRLFRPSPSGDAGRRVGRNK